MSSIGWLTDVEPVPRLIENPYNQKDADSPLQPEAYWLFAATDRRPRPAPPL